MTGELRPAMEVWHSAWDVWVENGHPKAAAVIEADREAVRAPLLAEIERLRTAGDQMLTAFAEGTNWTAEKRAAYEAMNAALAGDSHDQ